MKPVKPESGPIFPALDTLRFFGAAGVLATHTAFEAGAYTSTGTLGLLLARLDVGVAIFFVLSGFLLSRPWLLRAHEGRDGPSVRHYFWKRLLRVYPVYVVTAVIALTFLEDNEGRGPVDWLVTLGLADIYVHPRLPAGLTQMWSLATEVAFYVVLPLLMLMAVGRTRRMSPARVGALLGGMVLVSVVWLAWLGHQIPGSEAPGESGKVVNVWLPSYLTWFAVGIGLALLHVLMTRGEVPARVRAVVEGLAAAPGVLWVVALGLLLVATTPVAGPTLLIPPTEGEAVTKNLLYAAVGGLLVFSGIFATPGSHYQTLMSQPVLRHLGHTSYSLFCIHLPVLHLVMWMTGYELFDGHLLQITLLTLVLSLVAAELLYRFVELPFMRLRNLGRNRSAASPTTPPSVSTTR